MITEFEGTHHSTGPEETRALGHRLGEVLQGGEVVVLEGDLGTGKTTFIRGLALGLGVEDPDSVKSPSYTLALRYPGSKSLLHLDAYFMQHWEDLELCGMEDALRSGDVVAIEWGDRIREAIPSRAISVRLEHVSPQERRIDIAIPRSEKKPD